MAEFTTSEAREVAHKAIHHLTGDGTTLYARLIERFPIIMENIPPVYKQKLDDLDTCAMTIGDLVFLDTENLARVLTELRSEYYAHDDKYCYWDAVEEVESILAHEYTHILCQHVRQGQRFFDSNNRESKYVRAFMMACEIEANRGYMVNRRSVMYGVGVTEETFPSTKEAKYLPEIYQILKKEFGKSINEVKSEKEEKEEKEEQKQGEKQQNQKSPSEGSKTSQDEQKQKDGSDTNSESKNAQTGENEPNSSKNNSGEESKGDKGEEGKEKTSKNSQSSESENSQTQQSSEGEEEAGSRPLNGKQVKAIRQMLSHEGTNTEERMVATDLVSSTDESEEEFMDEILESLGMSTGSANACKDYLKLSPRGKLDAFNESWKANNIRSELAKLKGVIEGTVARERTRTYARQSRKEGEGGLMRKGVKRGTRSCPRILLALDSSGSMSVTTMTSVASAIAEIFKTCGRPTKGCYICKHNHRVSKPLPMKQWEKVAQSFYADGGNDFTKVMEEALTLGVDVVLNVGDGWDYTNRNESATRRFTKAGIKWYDVNVIKNRGQGEQILCLYKNEKHSYKPHIERTLIDLTGETKQNDFRK